MLLFGTIYQNPTRNPDKNGCTASFSTLNSKNSTLEYFLKDHVTLKTGIKFSFDHRNKLHFKIVFHNFTSFTVF